MASILKVDTIQDQSGNNIINENADTITIGASGDTITIPSGATINLSNATQTGVGGTNTPAFYAYQTNQQNVDSSTATIVTLDTELFDTDNAFNTSTSQFVIPTGKGGKYQVSATIRADATWSASSQFNVYVTLNGATKLYGSNDMSASSGNSASVSGIIAASAGDTLEMRVFHNEGGQEGMQPGESSTFFTGFKLIE